MHGGFHKYSGGWSTYAQRHPKTQAFGNSFCLLMNEWELGQTNSSVLFYEVFSALKAESGQDLQSNPRTFQIFDLKRVILVVSFIKQESYKECSCQVLVVLISKYQGRGSLHTKHRRYFQMCLLCNTCVVRITLEDQPSHPWC